MNSKLFLLLFISLISGFLTASIAQQDSSLQIAKQYTKSWFLLGSMGIATMKYHDGLEQQLDYYRNDVTHYSLDFDLGLYIRLNSSLLVGSVFNFGVDTFQNQSRWFRINQVMMSLSSIWHVNQDFEGFYIRGDLGLTNFLFSEKYDTYDNTHEGVASLFSIGYTFSLYKNARIAPYGTFQYSLVDQKSNYKFALGVQVIY